MRKIHLIPLILITSAIGFANPVVPMNKAFTTLTELIPFLTNEAKFVEKKNEKLIEKNLTEMEDAFKVAKHADLLKQDIFAPSLEIIRNELKLSKEAFKQGKKDYAFWRMRSITSQCMSCHSRLPPEHPSSFQQGSVLVDKNKFEDPYNLGLAYLIVRQYPEAKLNFTRTIDEAIVKKQYENILLPLKQLLLIQTKVYKDPKQMIKVLKHYLDKKGISSSDKEVMKTWMNRLQVWSEGAYKEFTKLSTDKEVGVFLEKVMRPLFKKNNLYIGKHDVDLLMAGGLLSNFMFNNPVSDKAPELLYWIGLSEKYLERENFFGSGELFLKECVQRYPKDPIAKKCFEEYKESIEFNFSGSRGTQIPDEVQVELELLEKLIKP